MRCLIRDATLVAFCVCLMLIVFRSPAAASAQEGEPTPFPTPGPPTEATITIKLIEDVNENGVIDDSDRPPVTDRGRARIYLNAWSDPLGLQIILEIDDAGDLTLTRIPAGDYSWRIGWFGGFVNPDADQALPHILRGAISVRTDGTVVEPDPLPREWPGLPGETINPTTAIFGRPPLEILIGKDTGAIVNPPGSGEASGVGTVDVAAVLLNDKRIVMPDAGVGASGDEPYRRVWVVMSIVAAMMLAFGLVLRRQS